MYTTNLWPAFHARNARSARRSVVCTSLASGRQPRMGAPANRAKNGPASRATILKPRSKSGMRSLLAQQQVDDPAAADVRPGAATVRQDGLVVAAGVEQRVGQDGEAVEGALLVDALRDLRDAPVVPVKPS